MRNRFVPALALLFSFALGLENLGAQVPGATPEDNPTGNTGALKAQIQTGGSYDAHSGNGTRIVTDLHVPGALGAYGLDFTRYWNSLHNDFDNPNAEWPMDFGASGWSHSWRWNAVYGEENEQAEDGGEQLFITSITITFPDGHASKYKIVRSNYWHYSQTWAPDPRLGPPYLPEHGEINGWSASGSINDHLGDMAADGSNFWLYLADGGAVHFVGQWPPNTSSGHAWWDYQAKEIFDPHGLRTDLTYNQLGYLTEVRQEGDRWLTITWGTLPGFGPVIARVETGGNAVSQYVTYEYERFPDQAGNLYVLAKVTYQDEPAPGQEVSALYTYGTCFGNETEPCFPAPYAIPLLKYADDPHYAGAMTKIGYNYSAGPRPPPPTPFNPDYFWAPLGIAVEKSGETGIPVSSFALYSFAGTRMETNGFGATRMFYFGRSAGDRGQFGYHCLGYQLAKLTDFSNAGSTSVPFEFQNYMQGQPREVWDGRGIRSELIVTPGDDSGQPGEIHHPDGSVHIYNRVDPGPSGSAARDPSRIHNPFNHWLFSQTDEGGFTTSYTRDARRRIKRIDYPDTSYETFTYDNNNQASFNQVTSHRLTSGVTITYEYDAYHRLQREYNSVDGWNARKEYTYDQLERVSTVSDGRSRAAGKDFSTRMTYNGRHHVLTVEYAGMLNAPDNPTVTYGYDKYGNCTSIRDELGHLRTYHYDSYRRCISYTEQVDACGVTDRTWNWYYDRDFGGPELIGASAHTSRQWRVQVEPAFNAAGDRRLSAHKFDYNDRIIEEYTGLFEAADGTWHGGPDTEVHSFTYDENGQKKKYTDPRGRDTTYEYDNRNRLWKTNETVNTPLPRTTETLYDTTGNKTVVIFPDTKTQQWLDYDAFGQPGRFIDERGNPTNLNYWPWGPMKKLAAVITHRTKDDGVTEDQPTLFYYDLMGRAQTTLFPDTSSEVSTYEFGQLKTWKTRRGPTKTITVYDARGRESSHTWDDGTPGITRVWDDANRLLTLANSVAALDYSYDDASQMLTEGSTVAGSDGYAPTGGGVRKQLSCCRYPSGEVSQLIYPNGSTVINRNYTARGQLQGVGWGSGSTSYAYLKDGRVDYQTWTHGELTEYEYDGRGIISSVRHRKTADGPDLAYREYWRDNRDRIVAWKRGTDSSQNWMEDGRGDRYGYDEEGQLKTASYRALTPEGTPSGAKRSDSFSYDELGNRVRSNYLASRGWMDFMRRNNGLNQYHSWENNRPPPDPHHWGSGIFYDDNITPPDPPDPQFPWIPPGNGVLMQDGYITAGFNALNQPFAMWSPAYLGTSNWVWFGYDPLGRCVKRWVGPAVDNHAPPANTNPATYYYYDGWNLVQEGPSASSADRIYVHGGRVDEIVASQAGGVWRYHHYDARGHCILLTDASGGILEQYDYDAFGQPYFYTAGGTRATTSMYGNRFLFTGREWLQDLRIYDYRARQYQPELGRFLQPDSKEFEAGDYNLYRYCHNDPVNKSDPTGLDVDFLLDTNNIAALGAGHAATLVGNDTTGYHFYSFGPGTSLRTNTDNMTQRSYSTHEAAMKDLSKQYEKTLSYKTDSKADAAANAEAQKHLSEDYKPVANNCGNVAAKIVGAAVPSFKAPTTFRPKDTYDANKKAADYSGPLKKEDEKGK